MTAKEYLTNIRNSQMRLKFLQDEILRLQTDAASASISLDGMPRVSGKGDKLERLAIKLAEYDTALKEELSALIGEKTKAIKMIAELPPKQQTILTKRYILAEKWERIAYEMDISWRHCHRLHAQALNNFDTILKKDH